MNEAGHEYLVSATRHGFCGIAWNDVGVTRLQLPARTADACERSLLRKAPGAVPGTPNDYVRAVTSAVKRYFEGDAVDFSDVQLDLPQMDGFSQAIYSALRRVGWGRTTTYGALAKELNAGPEAARDVGQAMAKNPIPLIIPCHRVLAAGNKVGGFSAPGGSAAKLRMLELEGVRIGPLPAAQQMLAL
jgi:methylated-DNA-[protein]-cysteine S-methyltransferase